MISVGVCDGEMNVEPERSGNKPEREARTGLRPAHSQT